MNQKILFALVISISLTHSTFAMTCKSTSRNYLDEEIKLVAESDEHDRIISTFIYQGKEYTQESMLDSPYFVTQASNPGQFNYEVETIAMALQRFDDRDFDILKAEVNAKTHTINVRLFGGIAYSDRMIEAYSKDGTLIARAFQLAGNPYFYQFLCDSPGNPYGPEKR